MELQYKSSNGRYTVKFSGETDKDLVEQLASFQELFENHTVCGNKSCNSETVVFQVRDIDSNKYYERKCTTCGYSQSMGQHKKGGGLFTKWDAQWKFWTSKQDTEEDDVFDSKKAAAKKSK